MPNWSTGPIAQRASPVSAAATARARPVGAGASYWVVPDALLGGGAAISSAQEKKVSSSVLLDERSQCGAAAVSGIPER
jgi:protein-disulfide isomerase